MSATILLIVKGWLKWAKKETWNYNGRCERVSERQSREGRRKRRALTFFPPHLAPASPFACHSRVTSLDIP